MRKANTASKPMRRLFILSVVAGMLSACSGVEPFDYTEVHEIPPGPGLISGEDGEFELYRGKRGGSAG